MISACFCLGDGIISSRSSSFRDNEYGYGFIRRAYDWRRRSEVDRKNKEGRNSRPSVHQTHQTANDDHRIFDSDSIIKICHRPGKRINKEKVDGSKDFWLAGQGFELLELVELLGTSDEKITRSEQEARTQGFKRSLYSVLYGPLPSSHLIRIERCTKKRRCTQKRRSRDLKKALPSPFLPIFGRSNSSAYQEARASLRIASHLACF